MLRPLGNNVILKIEKQNNITDSGIIIPSNNKDKVARVVAIGSKIDNNDLLLNYVKVDDKVIYKESSSYALLSALNPEYAIISCGRDNIYGHPHKETLDRLNNADCEIIYTYDVGEGENISFSFTKDGVKFLNK